MIFNEVYDIFQAPLVEYDIGSDLSKHILPPWGIVKDQPKLLIAFVIPYLILRFIIKSVNLLNVNVLVFHDYLV